MVAVAGDPDEKMRKVIAASKKSRPSTGQVDMQMNDQLLDRRLNVL